MSISLYDAVQQGLNGQNNKKLNNEGKISIERDEFKIGGEGLNDNEWVDVFYTVSHEWGITTATPITMQNLCNVNKYSSEIKKVIKDPLLAMVDTVTNYNDKCAAQEPVYVCLKTDDFYEDGVGVCNEDNKCSGNLLSIEGSTYCPRDALSQYFTKDLCEDLYPETATRGALGYLAWQAGNTTKDSGSLIDHVCGAQPPKEFTACATIEHYWVHDANKQKGRMTGWVKKIDDNNVDPNPCSHKSTQKQVKVNVCDSLCPYGYDVEGGCSFYSYYLDDDFQKNINATLVKVGCKIGELDKERGQCVNNQSNTKCDTKAVNICLDLVPFIAPDTDKLTGCVIGEGDCSCDDSL